MADRLTLADLVALRDECVAFRAEMQKRHDSGWTYNKPAWRLWGNAESLLSELIERREKEAVDLNTDAEAVAAAWQAAYDAGLERGRAMRLEEKGAADAAHSQAIGEMMDHFKDDAEAKEAADVE